MRISSPLLISPAFTVVLVAAIAVILLASNFTIINAQQQGQQSTSQPSAIGNGIAAATEAQNANDSFSVQVPDGWAIHDMDNTGSTLSDESTQGYGILAQLCPEEEEQDVAAALTNNSGRNDTFICEGSENDVIHIVRYPDLDTRLLAANNLTTTTNNNSMTTIDNILLYHLQKLQEVGYRDIEIVNSTDMTVNLTNPQTNQTITTVPAKTVEMTYTTAVAPDETRRGYFILTATDATAPNPGMTKGYTVFYEGSSAAEIITASDSLRPLPSPVVQIFDSFELIAAPEVAQAIAEQAAETAQGVEDEGDDEDDNDDGDDGADDGETDEEDNGGDGDGGDDDGGDGDGDDGNGGNGRGLADRLIEQTRRIIERVT